MLTRIHIQNLALIRDITLTLQKGLNIITGETGAGKSILVQAVGALLGEPVQTELIRTGESSAVVEGVFHSIGGLLTHDRFLELELVVEDDGELRVRREIHRHGRDRFLINEQVVRKSEFQWIGSMLLDITSQHSHHRLLKNSDHLSLFDAAIPPSPIHAELAEVFHKWQEANRGYHHLCRVVEETSQRHQLLAYQLEEIQQAEIRTGEKQALVEERERLRFAEEIMTSISTAIAFLDGRSDGVADGAARVEHEVRRAAQRDGRLVRLLEQAEALCLMARDLTDELIRERDRVEISPERLNLVSERLHRVQELERKFQNDAEGILLYAEAIRMELSGIHDQRIELNQRLEVCGEYRRQYLAADRALGAYRRQHAPILSAAMERDLADLGMHKARFDVRFDPVDTLEDGNPDTIPARFQDSGSDRVTFMFSANPGVPLKPIAMIASGGELSRIMLALKQHFGDPNESGLQIFDEVDAGIGGDVANAVGRHLKSLSARRQILTITHLPQIAVCGELHIVAEKRVVDDSTCVTMRVLSKDDRVVEIARMLSGRDDDPAALHHAARLLSG
ncbi:DNA repair protein RecN [bacterium]|nr:DNA repair protein RecN [candidate division CSSED10-310 bacterium]